MKDNFLALKDCPICRLRNWVNYGWRPNGFFSWQVEVIGLLLIIDSRGKSTVIERERQQGRELGLTWLFFYAPK